MKPFFKVLFVVASICCLMSRIQRNIQKAELTLLTDLAFGKKTFAQVSRDANTFSYKGTELSRLMFSNPARGISQRLQDLTGFSEDSLTWMEIRNGEEAAPHPFASLSDLIEIQYASNPHFFDISLPSSTAHFLNSRQYTAHELVQLCQGSQGCWPWTPQNSP